MYIDERLKLASANVDKFVFLRNKDSSYFSSLQVTELMTWVKSFFKK